METETLRKFGEEYFAHLKYPKREKAIKSHVLELLRWGSKNLGLNLLDGSGKSALDVGCAFGYGVSLLASLGYEAVGVDVSKFGVRQAKKRNRANDFAICDVQWNLPFKRKFDLVICLEVLEHLQNPLLALQNMYDVCDDIILCTTPNKTVERIVKKILKDFDKTHVNVKTPSEWERQIKNALGDSLVKVECFVDFTFSVADRLFFKSFRLPFGMDTRILIKKKGVSDEQRVH
ncbi:MAG: class I SAM-dependent methyltransferase [Candidatus Bathyarchaeia archaeon]